MARSRPPLTVVSGGDPTRPARERPVVDLRQGQRYLAIEELERHLCKIDGKIFIRHNQLVRPELVPVELNGGEVVPMLLTPVLTNEKLRVVINNICDIRKWDSRAQVFKSVDAPKDLAQQIIENRGDWQFPRISSLATAPVLRYDGSIVSEEGYDKRTAIYLDFRGTVFPKVDMAPGRKRAEEALELIESLFATLDLVDATALSVAVSAVMTPVLRSAMAAAPLHGITAPVPGSGKSKVVQIAATISVGHPVPVMSLGERDEETEKRLQTMLANGMPIISIDNAERPVGGQFLAQVITEPLVHVRLLGGNESMILPNIAAFYATGNNLRFQGDVAARRTLILAIDPKCERPEAREFEVPDPVVTALELRPQLVHAILTIVRAHITHGSPRERGPISPFGQWCQFVRDPLVWLGRPDPVLAMGTARRDDPHLAALVGVIEQWHRVLGDREVTSRELIEESEHSGMSGGWAHGEMRDALLVVAGESGGKLSPRRLGNWLARVRDRPVGRLTIVEGTMRDGVRRWHIVAAGA